MSLLFREQPFIEGGKADGVEMDAVRGSLLFREQPFMEGPHRHSDTQPGGHRRCSFGSSLSLRGEHGDPVLRLREVAALSGAAFHGGMVISNRATLVIEVAALSGAAFH